MSLRLVIKRSLDNLAENVSENPVKAAQKEGPAKPCHYEKKDEEATLKSPPELPNGKGPSGKEGEKEEVTRKSPPELLNTICE